MAIWGSSDFARSTLDIIEQAGRFRVAFFFDPGRDRSELCGIPVFGGPDDFVALIQKYGVRGGLVAVGDNWARSREWERIENMAPDFRFVSAVHPSAVLSRRATLGRGVVIMAGAVINNDAVIGDGAFVATRSSVDHDSQLGRFASVSAGSTIGGHVIVDAFSFVGIGASVVSGIRIGAHTVVGAGATVLRDLPDQVIAYGVPARIRARREAGDPYLFAAGCRSNGRTTGTI